MTPVEFVPTVELEDDGPYFATRLEDYIAEMTLSESFHEDNKENHQTEIEEHEEDKFYDNGPRESLRFYTNS